MGKVKNMENNENLENEKLETVERDNKTIIESAEKFNKEKEYEKALEELEIVKFNGENYTLDDEIGYSLEMGITLTGLDRYEESLTYFYRYFETEDGNVRSFYEFAYALGRCGRYEEALEYLKKIENSKDRTVNIISFCSEMAWNLIQLERYEESIKYLRILREAGRDDIWSNTQHGLAYIGIGEIYTGLNYLLIAEEYCLNQGEEMPYLLSQIGLVLGSIGKNKEAVEYLERAKDMGREDAWLYSQMGFNLGQLGRYNEALSYLLKGKEMGKRSAWMYSQIGWCLNKVKRHTEAITYLIASQDISDEESSWVEYQLGLAYKGVKRYELALDHLFKAAEDIELSASINLEIAEIYALVGKKQKGIEHLKKLGEINNYNNSDITAKCQDIEELLIKTPEFIS